MCVGGLGHGILTCMCWHSFLKDEALGIRVAARRCLGSPCLGACRRVGGDGPSGRP